MARPMQVARYLIALAMVGTLASCATGVAAPETAPVAVAGSQTPGAGEAKLVCRGPATAQADPSITPVVADATPVLPTTITDNRGKQITISSAERILALDVSGTLATTVHALGLGDRLIGRDISTGIPELQGLPTVTHNGHQLNGEAILNLNPDLVLTNYSIGPLEVQLQLEQSGIPLVIMGNQPSLESIGPQIREVAAVFGLPDLGGQLAARVDADLATARARIAELAPDDPAQRLRMAFLYMRGNVGVYSWFGKGTGADVLIEELQGVDVATEVGVPGSRPLNAEALVAARPEMFLMMTKGLASVGGVDGLRTVPGVGDTDAGRSACVIDMSDYQVLSFGPMFPATLTALAEAVYQRAAPA